MSPVDRTLVKDLSWNDDDCSEDDEGLVGIEFWWTEGVFRLSFEERMSSGLGMAEDEDAEARCEAEDWAGILRVWMESDSDGSGVEFWDEERGSGGAVAERWRGGWTGSAAGLEGDFRTSKSRGGSSSGLKMCE